MNLSLFILACEDNIYYRLINRNPMLNYKFIFMQGTLPWNHCNILIERQKSILTQRNKTETE